MGPYPNARFEPSELAIDQMEEQGLTLQEVTTAIQDYADRSAGLRPRQYWYRGPRTAGRRLKVLIEERGDTLIKIITVRTVQ